MDKDTMGQTERPHLAPLKMSFKWLPKQNIAPLLIIAPCRGGCLETRFLKSRSLTTAS